MFVNTAYTLFATIYHMRNFVYNFGTYAHFADTLWIQFFVLGDALTATTVQAFYAERAYRLLGSGKRLLGVGFLVILGCCM